MAKQLNVNLSVTADTGQAKAQLQSLQQSLQQLTSNSANLKIGLDSSQLQQASAQVTELGIHLKQAINPETGLLNFAKLNTSIKSSGQSLKDYGAALISLGPQGQQAFTQLASAVAKAEIPTRRLSGLLGNMGTVLKNTIRWQLSSSLIHGFVGSIQQAFGYAKDLNKSLTDIQIVTQASDEHMAKFAEQANKAAKQLNTTTTAYTKASLIYYQQGLNDKEVKERTDVTVKMANITGQTAETVSNQLTAIWNNFAKGGENLEYYADVITALGAATASSSAEISTGLQKFAAIADTVGLSYENATAALATITATTRQSADTVGTGLRTVFSRLESLSLGKTLEDGVGLTKYSKALKTIGVDVLDAAGNLRGMNEVLEDMGAAWANLSDAQKTAVAQTVGGVRQYTTIMALMENFDFYKQNQQVAANAEGTVQAQADIYAKSWEASQKRVKASAEAIYSDLINDQFFIGLNNGFSSFLNILDNIIDGLGGLKGLLSTIGALSLKLFSKEATQGLINFSKNLQTIFMSPAQAQAKQTEFLDWAAGQMAGRGASEESVSFAKQQIKLQQDYVKNAMAMDESSRMAYQTYVDNYEKNRLSYLNTEQKIAQSKNNQDIISSNLWSSSANGGYQDAQIKQLKNFVKEYNATLEKGIGNITGEQYQKMQSYLQQGRIQWVNGKLKRSYSQAPFELNRDDFNQALSTQIEEPLKKFPEYEKILQNFTGDVGNLAAKLNATDMDKNMIAEITKAYESGGLDGAVKAFHQLNAEQIGANVEKFANAWGVSAERVQQYVNEVQAAQGDTQKLAEIKRQMDQDIANANQTLGKQNSQIQTAQGITQMAQGLMGIASAASALNSIVDTIQRLNDGTMSASEGVLALGTSLSTALMMGIMGFNGLTAAAKTLNLAISSGPLLAISIALMALPLVIRGLDALIETQEEKTQRLQEELQQTQEWAQNAQNASQDLLEAQGAHNNLLDEINSLTQGTTEFYNAVIHANSAARDMIEQYHLKQGQDFYYDSNGAIRFTESGTAAMEKQSQAAIKQSTYQQIAAGMAVEADRLGDTKNIRDNLIKNELLGNSTYLNAVGGTDNDAFDLFIKDYNDYMETLVKNGEQFDFNKYMSHLRETNFGGQFTEDELKEYLEGTNFSKVEDFVQAFIGKMSSTLDFSSLFNSINLNENLGLNDLQVSFAEALFENTISAEQFQTQLEEEEKAINKSGKSLQDFYAEVLGFYPDEELAKDEAQMKKQIARARVISKYSEQLRALGQQSQNLQKYSDYKDVSMSQLSEYIAQAQKEGPSGEFAAAMMQAYYNSTAKNINNKLKDLGLRSVTSKYSQYGGAPIEEVTGLSVENLEALGMTAADMNSWMRLQTQASQLFGADSDFANNLGRTLITEGNEFKRGLQNALLNVDWSNQLSATLDLARMSKQATEAGMSIAGDLTAVYQEAFSNIGGKTGILEQMYKTEEFQDVLKDLQKDFKKTGKISASSIKDAAKSCDILNDALEYGGISAGALADIIEATGWDGTLALDSLSEEFLELLTIANQFEDSMANAFDYIDQFGNKLDRSTQDFSDFYNSTSKDIFDLLGEGNVGGNRLYQEWASLWGDNSAKQLRQFFYNQEKNINPDNPQGRSKAFDEQYGEYTKVMQQTQKEGNMRAYWEALIKGTIKPIENEKVYDENGKVVGYKDRNGNTTDQKYEDTAKRLQDVGFTVNKEGDIELDTQGRTTEQVVTDIMDTLGLSRDEANARLQELAGHSASISQDLRENDFRAGISDLEGRVTNQDLVHAGLMNSYEAHARQGARTEAGKYLETALGNMSLSEQNAFLASNADLIDRIIAGEGEYTKAEREALKQLKEQNKELKTQIKNSAERAREEEGATSETVGKKVAEDYRASHEGKGLTDEFNVDGIMNATKAMEAWKATGLTSAEAWSAAASDAEASGAKLEHTFTDKYGHVQKVALETSDTYEEAMDKIQKATEEANDKADIEFGKRLAEGFAEFFTQADKPINLKIDVQTEEAQGKINTLKQDVPITAKVTDGGTVAATQGRINSLKANTVIVPVGANTTGFEESMKALVEKEYSVNVKVHATGENEALGGYVTQSYAMGSANRNISPGLSLTAEEGPEIIWNKNDGYSYLVGGNGHPEFVMLRPGDRVFNANQTREILNHDKPDSNYYNSILDPSKLDQRLFGSFASGRDSAYGSYGPNSRYGGGGSGKNQKTKDYTPERYHVITRQIQDLTFWYEELKKARENAYGTNILDHIDEEIKGTEELIKAQQALVDEAMHYREVDLQRMKDLGIKFELDENGNIRNWDALQEKYRKDAEAGDEAAKERWNAIQQYEESLDKWQEAYAEFTDLRLQMAELQLERITTKTELKIDFDERDMNLIEHFMEKIDDNIYDTARVLQLAGAELTKINDKIDSTRLGIEEIFENMVDSEGNKIADMTLERFLALSEAERDALDINGNFGKQLEEYSDNLLDYIEELEELKTKGVDELADALDELNDNIERSMGLFDHYSDLLGMLRDITDLQGVKLSAEMKGTLRDINNIMFLNTQNNIDAERSNYERLTAEVADLRAKVAATQDETLKKQWQEQLEAAEDQLNDSENRMLELWQTGLDQAKQMFEDALDDAVETYESSIAGMYETTTELQKAWDQQKANDDFYVKDFEKYYQISKLQRSITRDLDAARKAGTKQSEGLKKLYDDLNKARENGVELSAYDLDIFAKRYEYEKALADLEDARNAKSIVRLQRDRNGNWGYVYTSNMDEDDLMQKQQAIDDKFYELQKATQERVKSLSDDMMSEITGVGSRLQELYASGASQEVIDKYLEQEQEYLNKYKNGLETALRDAGMTEEEARERYGNAGFDILNEFQETLFSAITGGNEGLDEFFARIGIAIHDADNTMADAGDQYRSQMDAVNKWFNESGQDLATVIKGFASMIGDESGTNLVNTQAQIQNAKDTFTEILQAANDFENQFMAVYEPIIKRNEQFILQLNAALDALNRKEFVGGTLMPYIGSYIDPSSFDTGGFTGDWGAGGRLAVLHEKENVFNAEDTARLLSASQILRTIDLQTNIFSKGLGNISTPAVNDGLSSDFEQNVVINADFPNVVNHAEIEEAFNNLANKATQYANRKNK